jgi:hypothetical protein
MAKSRKKVFPKKPEAWTTKVATRLGRGSNVSIDANLLSIYNNESRKQESFNKRELLKRALYKG